MSLKIEIGKRYLIPAGSEFWSAVMREHLICKNDMIIKITEEPKLGFGNQVIIYGVLQNKITNYLMSAFVGENMASLFTDKNAGEIGVEKSVLREI